MIVHETATPQDLIILMESKMDFVILTNLDFNKSTEIDNRNSFFLFKNGTTEQNLTDILYIWTSTLSKLNTIKCH